MGQRLAPLGKIMPFAQFVVFSLIVHGFELLIIGGHARTEAKSRGKAGNDLPPLGFFHRRIFRKFLVFVHQDFKDFDDPRVGVTHTL